MTMIATCIVLAMNYSELDYATAPGFLINGLKREELVAMNSMILHEHFFDALGGGGRSASALAAAIERDFCSFERWCAEFPAMGELGDDAGNVKMDGQTHLSLRTA